MEVFIGTVIIVFMCCIAMSLGLILSGKPLPGGCGKHMPGATGCVGCPRHGKRKGCRNA